MVVFNYIILIDNLMSNFTGQSSLKKRLAHILRELNLTPTQSELFMAILSSGGDSVANLSEQIGVARTSSYYLVDVLKQKGLIYEEYTPSGTIIRPVPGERIIELLQDSEKKFKAFKEQIYDMLPEYNAHIPLIGAPFPTMSTYKGISGIKRVIQHIIDHAENTVKTFTNKETQKRIFTRKLYSYFLDELSKKELNSRTLFVDNIAGRRVLNSAPRKHCETNLLPKQYVFSADMYIYPPYLTLLDISEHVYGIIICSESLSRLQTQVFDNLWDSLNH